MKRPKIFGPASAPPQQPFSLPTRTETTSALIPSHDSPREEKLEFLMANKVRFRYAFRLCCDKNNCTYTHGVISSGFYKDTQYRSRHNLSETGPIVSLAAEMVEIKLLNFLIYGGDEKEIEV